ncbi:peptide chain release factor N(5)-glutamine methyltransferase [Candidatus Peregrinibacteria bacterium]|nr:peptide chain release factor N(5)-glutamine methyltransferase [Candidatus Peregrinibacteria bacterium]MBI3816663.1 peptide chain release factor N(5)-glutamine methyltransferase [Candidatus Peregrinibacteria bacterium]
MRIADALKMGGLARTDCEVLLSALLQRDRAWIFAHPENVIDPQVVKKFEEWSDRRLLGEPIAYIVGEKEFYGRSFFVDRSVLIPRPATEGLVELALRFLETGQGEIVGLDSEIVGVARKIEHREQFKKASGNCPQAPFDSAQGDMPAPQGKKSFPGIQTIIDIGTGSGCIAVTLALERPDLQIIATDVSGDALKIARKNAQRHGVSDRIEFRHGKNLEPILELDQPFIIVSNPPYIPEGTTLPKDVTEYEPHEALFAGPNGTDVLKTLFMEAENHRQCRGIAVECQKDQIPSLSA